MKVQSRFTEPAAQPGWPENRADLHCHTDRSDGVLTPQALYQAMADVGLEIAAITDHDTLAGYRLLRADPDVAGADKRRPRLVSGVEINSVADQTLIDLGAELEEGELHILGYGVDADDATFETRLEEQRNSRRARLELMIEALRKLGKPIDDQIAPAMASEEAVGRPHVARAMVAAGHVSSVQEAFDLWIDRKGAAYVPRQGLNTRQAIDAITSAGGICVLAHYPAAPEQPTLIRLLMDWGVSGLEVYYRRFRRETIVPMIALADELGLLPTGGSDYHGDTMTYAESNGTTYVPRGAAERLQEALIITGARA